MRVAIDQNQINQVASAVESLSNSASAVRGTVSRVHATANDLDQGVTAVKQEFAAYLEYDAAQKNLLNAKSEIVKVRMELEEKYGINKEIRRYLTGILEASDLSIVKQEVINNCTEKMMMDCKGYWLAPCLVALAAWLGDNRELADRALREAMKRDDEKTSLLFALICRRIGRQRASILWLERYLGMQDPRQVERKMVTVLDAYSNGLFGQQAKDLCEAKIRAWITEMSEVPGFAEAQRDSWEDSISSKMHTGNYDGEFPYSARRVRNWKECTNSLNETSLHQTILDYFKDIFEKPSASAMALNEQLDQLLENYISSYDNEELPLRRRERELELIIEERGNLSRAQERLASEQKALDEILDFTQLLTSAAMHADVIKASNATQRLAIALSKDWVISAYENTVLKIRQGLVQKFEMEIEGWKGETVDGSEEQALAASSLNYFSALRDREIANQQHSRLDIALPIICGALALISLFSANGTWALILGIGAGGLLLRWHLNRKKIEKIKLDIRERYAKIITDVKNTIKAILAEKVDFDRKIAQQDAVAEATLDYLQQIEAVQYVKHVEGRAFHNLEVG